MCPSNCLIKNNPKTMWKYRVLSHIFQNWFKEQGMSNLHLTKYSHDIIRILNPNEEITNGNKSDISDRLIGGEGSKGAHMKTSTLYPRTRCHLNLPWEQEAWETTDLKEHFPYFLLSRILYSHENYQGSQKFLLMW